MYSLTAIKIGHSLPRHAGFPSSRITPPLDRHVVQVDAHSRVNLVVVCTQTDPASARIVCCRLFVGAARVELLDSVGDGGLDVLDGLGEKLLPDGGRRSQRDLLLFREVADAPLPGRHRRRDDLAGDCVRQQDVVLEDEERLGQQDGVSCELRSFERELGEGTDNVIESGVQHRVPLLPECAGAAVLVGGGRIDHQVLPFLRERHVQALLAGRHGLHGARPTPN